MPNKSFWILLTSDHITETRFPPNFNLWHYIVAPGVSIKKGDVTYFWSNIANGLFGWGEVVEPAEEFTQSFENTDRQRHRHRLKVRVRRIQEFYPPFSPSQMERDSNVRNLIPRGYDDLYALELRPGQAGYLDDFIRANLKTATVEQSQALGWQVLENAPDITIQTLLLLGDETSEGRLVEAVGIAWDEVIRMLQFDPNEIYNIDPRKFEEIIAGAYHREGWIVELTPRSGDNGRDVVATKNGIGSIKIFDQIKRYKIHRPVTADEVRSLGGVLLANPAVTKGVITTTSTFAPHLHKDKMLASLIPYRLELKPKDILLPWLQGLGKL